MAYVPYDPRNPMRRMPGYGAPPAAPTQPSGGWDITPEIQNQVFGIINPQLQSAADIINRRGQMGTQAISGLTGQLQSRLGGIGGMLGGWGEESQRAAIGYGQQMLTGAGKQQAQSLGQTLKQIGPGIRGPGDVNLAQEGKGAGGAAYGTGIASLDAMIAAQAAAQTRSALEPSFAAMGGQQQQSLLAGQLARQLYEQQSTIQARVPELVMNLQNQAYNRQADLRDYNLRLRSFQAEQAAKKTGQVGPYAPTRTGRQAYWQSVAEKRNEAKSDPRGYVWTATDRGLQPVKDPKTGKPIVASWYTAAVNEGLISAQKEKAGRMTVVGSDKTGRFLIDPLNPGQRVRLTDPYQEPTKPIRVTTANGRVATWDPNTNQVTVAGGYNPARPKKGAAKYGPQPRRTGQGTWVSSTGTPLNEAASKFWEGKFQGGFTDGKGNPLPGKPTKKKEVKGSVFKQPGMKLNSDGLYYPPGQGPDG